MSQKYYQGKPVTIKKSGKVNTRVEFADGTVELVPSDEIVDGPGKATPQKEQISPELFKEPPDTLIPALEQVAQPKEEPEHKTPEKIETKTETQVSGVKEEKINQTQPQGDTQLQQPQENQTPGKGLRRRAAISQYVTENKRNQVTPKGTFGILPAYQDQ